MEVKILLNDYINIGLMNWMTVVDGLTIWSPEILNKQVTGFVLYEDS